MDAGALGFSHARTGVETIAHRIATETNLIILSLQVN
jgi:hypothetical protein